MSKDELPLCFGTIEVLRPQSRAENCCDDCPHETRCRRHNAMDKLIAQDADLIDVEPVAWMYAPTDRNGAAAFTMFSQANMDPRYWTETPLYTREQAERETVEKIVAWLRSSGSRFDAILADELEEGAWKP